MSHINEFSVGDLVRITAEFRDIAAALTDPAVVRFQKKNPAGTVVAYLYGTDGQLVKDSTGKYHVDVDANLAGTWFYRFYSTGSAQAAEEKEFRVAGSQFD